MWATARYDLRLSSAEFYSLTPRQFDALNDRHRRAEAVAEAPLANLQALVYNIGGRPDRPAKTEEFMRSTWGRAKPTQASTTENDRSIADKFRAFGKIVAKAQNPHG